MAHIFGLVGLPWFKSLCSQILGIAVPSALGFLQILGSSLFCHTLGQGSWNGCIWVWRDCQDTQVCTGGICLCNCLWKNDIRRWCWLGSCVFLSSWSCLLASHSSGNGWAGLSSRVGGWTFHFLSMVMMCALSASGMGPPDVPAAAWGGGQLVHGSAVPGELLAF